MTTDTFTPLGEAAQRVVDSIAAPPGKVINDYFGSAFGGYSFDDVWLAQVAADLLTSTNLSLADLGPKLSAAYANPVFRSALHREVTKCWDCGWWHLTDQMESDGRCPDCHDGN